MAGNLSDEAGTDGEDDGRTAGGSIELGEDVAVLLGGGVRIEEEHLRDLPIGETSDGEKPGADYRTQESPR
jgi:hypothetical protein